MKPHIFHVGQRVRVLRPRWIARIGYPLIWSDLMDEVENSPNTLASYQKMTGAVVRKTPYFWRIACAKALVEARGFGGNERKIIYDPGVYPAGEICTVTSRRLAKTGLRYPSRGGVDYSGEYWEEPGGLENCKTHIILTLDGWRSIEACDVEFVK